MPSDIGDVQVAGSHGASTAGPPGDHRPRTSPVPLRAGDRLTLGGAGVLVAGVAVLAFAVSFDAISTYAVATGAFPPGLGWAAPLLVDTFTAAATLVVFVRSRVGARAAFAWAYVAASTLVSLTLNVAHAPDLLDAQLIAALPPVAQLAAIELLMSEARRLTRTPPPAPSQPVRSEPQPGGAAPVADADEILSARARISTLLTGAERATVTGPQAAAVAGISLRRAQQILQELRSAPDDVQPREETA